MQFPTLNSVTQGKHGQYNAVDFDNDPDPYFYAPEDGEIHGIGVDVDCGKKMFLAGKTGRSGFCHIDTYYVKEGQLVKRGQKLAKMGYTGLTDPDNVPAGAHLHWTLLVNGVFIYPPMKVNEKFIKEEDMYKGHTAKYWYTEYMRSHKNSLVRRSLLDKIKGLIK